MLNFSTKTWFVGRLIAIALIIGLAFNINSSYSPVQEQGSNVPRRDSQKSAEVPVLSQAPVPALPSRLEIPKLGVESLVETVGLDSQARMDVPKNVNNVAWYQLGYKPGESGNAVIAGHFDTVTGAPSVFYYLSSLQNGDQIIVTDQQGKTYTFTVSDSRVYDFDKFPLEQVFAASGKSRLVLITCEGVFNQASRNYSQRTVVYADLVSV